MQAESAAPPSRRIRGPELATIGACRREAARLYRSARRGELDPSTAARLAHVLAVCLRAAERERELEVPTLSFEEAARMASRLGEVVAERVTDPELRASLLAGFRQVLGETAAVAVGGMRESTDDADLDDAPAKFSFPEGGR